MEENKLHNLLRSSNYMLLLQKLGFFCTKKNSLVPLTEPTPTQGNNVVRISLDIKLPHVSRSRGAPTPWPTITPLLATIVFYWLVISLPFGALNRIRTSSQCWSPHTAESLSPRKPEILVHRNFEALARLQLRPSHEKRTLVFFSSTLLLTHITQIKIHDNKIDLRWHASLYSSSYIGTG